MAKYYKEKNENVGSEIYSRRINDLLFEKQITQEELAKETGVSKPTISAWIMGKYEPKIKGLKSVADYLGVTVDYLIGNTDIRQPNERLQAINRLLGLNQNSIEILSTLNKYKIGDNILQPVAEKEEVHGIVTSEYDKPTYIINLLLNNSHLLGLFYSYMTAINDDNKGVYQGDKATTILFEMALEVRKLRDEYLPQYKQAFENFFKDGEENGNNK